ncbi:MAG: hypothetical protein JSV04_10795 [Candidatus Heimdallarchaeota archaeon]|nr:MAG: hypothetical protein JSV04_10795 [Candidatus Heimdallarchaeota archaeon]
MKRGETHPLKNKRTVYAGFLLLIVWGFLSAIMIILQVPFVLYLEFSENPWQPINSKTYPETGVATIDFVDSYHGWIAGENGMIMVTTDGGISWEDQHSGIDVDIRAIDFFDVNIGVAISNENDILITQNGGKVWILLKKVTSPNNATDISLWDLVTCDEHTAWVLGLTGTFFRVDILNQNWTYVSKVSHVRYLAMVNSSHGWATGGSSKIVKTTDGWQSIEIQSAGVSQSFYGIFFWDVRKGWVVGSDNTILATTDGGQHWQVQYTYRPFLQYGVGVSFLDIFFITEEKGWTVGSGIHYTKDGGKTWYDLGSETWTASRIAFANKTHGWAVSSRKERSYITSVGGVPPIDEKLLILGGSIGISLGVFSPVLVMVALILFQQHKTQNFKSDGH